MGNSGNSDWRTGRILAWWGFAVACIIALVQGAGGLQHWSIVALAILGAVMASLAVFEHRWHQVRILGMRPLPTATLLMLVIWGVMALIAYEAWPKGEPAEGFFVEFRTEFIDLTKNPADAMFWLYGGGPVGSEQDAVISPVAVTVFLEVTNLYPRPVTILKYHLSIYNQECGWVSLTPMKSQSNMLLFGYSGLSHMPMIDLRNSLDAQWANPIRTGIPELGMLFFDAESACTVASGSTVKFRMELLDSTGKAHTYDSDGRLVWNKMQLGSLQEGRPNPTRLTLSGLVVNASEMSVDSGGGARRGRAIVTVESYPATILLPDGTFLATTQQRPPE